MSYALPPHDVLCVTLPPGESVKQTQERVEDQSRELPAAQRMLEGEPVRLRLWAIPAGGPEVDHQLTQQSSARRLR